MRFADAAYFIALLNPRDEWHDSAVELSHQDELTFSTEWVIVEVGSAMSKGAARQAFIEFMQDLEDSDSLVVVPADGDWFTRGLELYCQRSDKGWSVVDCISFLVMQDNNIADALTSDHHFAQAGFHVLLK